MQHLESRNKFYDVIPDMVEEYMKKVQEITGREYHLFNYTGAPDAEDVIVIMAVVLKLQKKLYVTSSHRAARLDASISICSVRGRKNISWLHYRKQ